MTDSFAPVEPGQPAESQGPAAPATAPLAHTVSTPPPPVIAPAKKGDRRFASSSPWGFSWPSAA